MAKFKKVGGGSYGVYKKQAPVWPTVVSAIVIFLIVAAIIGS